MSDEKPFIGRDLRPDIDQNTKLSDLTVRDLLEILGYTPTRNLERKSSTEKLMTNRIPAESRAWDFLSADKWPDKTHQEGPDQMRRVDTDKTYASLPIEEVIEFLSKEILELREEIKSLKATKKA